MSSDQTPAYFERWIVIPFGRTFTEEEADPKLLSKLTTPQELSGLLVQAVSALNHLMERGRFQTPASVTEAGQAYRDKLDTVRGFVADESTIAPGAAPTC